VTETTDAVEPQQQAEESQPKYDWNDPSVPAGDAPPMPRWPLIVSSIAFGLWFIFLVVMAIVRVKTTSY
jgi:hypothetical protein